MRKWGYILDMPEGPGGDKPNEVGYTMKCERCSQPYMVKPKEQAEGCEYHYGKQFTHKVNGKPFNYTIEPDSVFKNTLQAKNCEYILAAQDQHLTAVAA